VSWEAALDLLAAELRRVYGRYGPDGVYGGSYGWASAGRFHHAQSQLHRFLNGLGGYVRSVNNYSFGTSSVLLPHVVGDVGLVMEGATAWSVIAEHTDLVVAFGGLSPKNSAVAAGGIGRHTTAQALAAAVARGCRLVSVSPLRTDIDASLGAEWIAPAPGTDAALMLALCHVLDAEGLADRCFLDRYTVGYPRFAGYLRGDSDGVPKTPAWAAALTGIAAERIRGRAHDDHGQLVAAARRARGTAGLAGPGAGRDARADRLAGRRLRARVRIDRGRREPPPDAGAASAAGCERRQLLHPGGQDRGHAAASGRYL
jgi:biotin/methionine sulfoxide reductase